MQNIISAFYISGQNLILAITGLLITIFAVFFTRSHINARLKEYYLVNIIYAISFLVVIFSKNWIIFFTAWEFVTITTSIILIWKNKELAGQYFIIQFAGSGILLFVILTALSNGYTEIMPIKEVWLQNLFILGLGMKSALFGFHFWLPSIYLQAPVTFNAISSGWVVKLGYITMLRIIVQGNQLLLLLGILMIFVGGIKALKENDFKLLLTYSSISQLGYIAVGIASGTVYGYIGSVLHIIAHGIAKTGLFLSCGNFIKEYGSRCIYDFRNTWYRKKLSSLTIILSFASLMGIPLFVGFNSKYLIKYGLKDSTIFVLILYAASLLTALYSLRFLYIGIFEDLIKNRKNNNFSKKHNLRVLEYLVLIVIGTLLLLVGFNAEIIISAVGKIDFNYNLIKNTLEVCLYLLLSIIILKKIDWLKSEKEYLPSLDILFKNINKGLYNTGRYLYRVVYFDFQYQLLWLPLFLLILFIITI